MTNQIEAEAITPDLVVMFDGDKLWLNHKGSLVALEATELNSVVNFARRVWPIKDICPMCLRWSRDYMKKGQGA